MAFPSVRSSTKTDGPSATTTPTINLPSTISAGDTILVVFRSATSGAIGWPDADWNEMFDASADAADDQFAAAWKKANGSEGGTTIQLTSGNGRFASVAYAVQNAADPTVTPPELSSVATGTSTNPDPLTCTPTGGAKDYLWIAFFGADNENTSAAAPIGFDFNQQFGTSGSAGSTAANCSTGGASRPLNAASLDASNFLLGNAAGNWTAYTLAFHPAAAATPKTNAGLFRYAHRPQLRMQTRRRIA